MTEWYRVCPHCKDGEGRVVKKIGRLRRLRCFKCAKLWKVAFRVTDLRKEKPPPPDRS